MKDDTKVKIMNAIKLAKEGLEFIKLNPKEAVKRFEEAGKGLLSLKEYMKLSFLILFL